MCLDGMAKVKVTFLAPALPFISTLRTGLTLTTAQICLNPSRIFSWSQVRLMNRPAAYIKANGPFKLRESTSAVIYKIANLAQFVFFLHRKSISLRSLPVQVTSTRSII